MLNTDQCSAPPSRKFDFPGPASGSGIPQQGTGDAGATVVSVSPKAAQKRNSGPKFD